MALLTRLFSSILSKEDGVHADSLMNSEKNTAQYDEAAKAHRNRPIKYYPELIEVLKQDHISIFALHSTLLTAIESRDYPRIKMMLGELRATLQAHVVKENVQLYTYLKNNRSDDPSGSCFIKDAHKEMNGIVRRVSRVTKQYEDVTLTEKLQRELTNEIKDIGRLLAARVEMEEAHLYPLYTKDGQALL
jgi:iron-sulfur cluster repair protein YtfE (RIC family)